MNDRKLKQKIVCTIFLVLFMCIINITTFAANGSFSVTPSKTSLNIGENATISIAVSNCEGQFTFSSSNPNVASIDASSKWIGGENGNTFTLTVTAKAEGTTNIVVTPSDVSDTSFNSLEGAQSVTITVNKQVAQSNATLKSITVGEKVYANPNNDFTVTVDSSVSSVNVTAVANDPNAKIAGTGAKELSTGTNNVTLTVTNPDGAKGTYVIRIRKLADTAKSTPNVSENNGTSSIGTEGEPEQVTEIQTLALKYLMIQDVELDPEFTPEVFNYKAEITNIDKLDIVASANDEQASIEITGNEDLQEGTNQIIIKVSKEGMDSVEYTIEVTKQVQELLIGSEEETNTPRTTGTTEAGGMIKKIAIGFAAGVAIIALIMVIRKVSSGGVVATRARRVAERRHSFDDFDD